MSEMRLKDYIERMPKEEYEEVFANIEKEEKRLRKFLERFEEDQLCIIADMLNDAFQLPADDIKDVTDFIVELYKCQKADYFYESVNEVIDDIKMFAEEEEF